MEHPQKEGMTMPVTTPITTPVIPGTSPETTPWREVYTDPSRICPQQTRELGSPDIEP
mgnify:CR=1 FL=1